MAYPTRKCSTRCSAPCSLELVYYAISGESHREGDGERPGEVALAEEQGNRHHNREVTQTSVPHRYV
jgi:hypothetical protein